MPVTQDRLSRLREFGLSEYAARAYLALLDLGIAEARDVSSLSKVPQAKIYHVLEQLHEKGLVVVLPEFPKKYAPVPFEEYLDRLYEEHRKAAGTIEAERDDLAELFRVVGDTDVGDRGFFTVLRGRRNVVSKVEEVIGATRRDLLVVGTAGTAERSAKLLPELRRAKERGAALRFLVPLEPGTLEGFARLEGLAQVRARELRETDQSAKVVIVVSDGRAAFLVHFVPDDGSLVHGKDVGVFTDQEAMVAALLALVEPHWARAPTWESLRGGGPAGASAEAGPEAERAVGGWTWVPATGEAWCSEGFCRILGIEAAKAPATLDALLLALHPEDRPLLRATLDRALAAQEAFATSARAVRPDGGVVALEVHGTVLPEGPSGPARVAAACRVATRP